MRNDTNPRKVTIKLEPEVYNILANILFAIHCINDQPLITNNLEIGKLLQQLVHTKHFRDYLETTFDFYDNLILKEIEKDPFFND